MPKLTGRYAMMEQLVAEGVTHVFGNPGTTEQGFMDALQDYSQIEYILALHEATAIGIADGYARASHTARTRHSSSTPVSIRSAAHPKNRSLPATSCD